MSTTGSLPSRGEIWKDNNTEVQISDFHKGNVMFKYIKESSGLEGFTATMRIEAFIERYTEIDVFEAQNQRIKPGEEWWGRRNPARRAVVLSLLNGVVTFEHTFKDIAGAVDALREVDFLAAYTNVITSPSAEFVADYPAFMMVQILSSDQRFWCWTDDTEPHEFGGGGSLLRVPIDWTKATWEVEPS